MEFCPECEMILRPHLEKGKNVLKCLGCGYIKNVEGPIEDISPNNLDKAKKMVIIEEEPATMSKKIEICPKCKNREAYYWSVQTRSADEPATIFYRCTKCKHTWRDYS
ncbi:MAG: transcription factor S [Candidatus Lokiarchaeota archaeon]|nr:transcription factor S [Candidatus Lokiarchaeota archaeon]